MIEYVFRPTRMRKGKRVQARLYSGAYSLGRAEKARRVALHTPDKVVAQKRLRDIIVGKQREREGIIAPESVRVASALPASRLIEAYKVALVGLGRDPEHVKGTVNRLLRMASEIEWKRLADVRPDTFTAWLSHLDRAAKTRKEYQVSANAWLNWLVKTDQLPRNPLARLDHVEIRGKQVREARSLAPDEIERWLSVSGKRRCVYLSLLYTGMRKGELRKLLRSDVKEIDSEHPYLRIRAKTTKGKKTRVVPIHPALAVELRRLLKESDGKPDASLFDVVPRWATLQSDFRKAGIPHRDASGRVVHFHALRKTFQTLGVTSGVNQRSAQALLGHSDPSLTAGPYTDVAGLDLHREIERLPWMGGGDVVKGAQKCASPATSGSIRALFSQLMNLAQVVIGHEKTALLEAVKMVDATGLEPESEAHQVFEVQCSEWLLGRRDVAGDAQINGARLAFEVLAKTLGALTGAPRSPTQKGRGVRRSRKPDGMTHSDGVRKGGRK